MNMIINLGRIMGLNIINILLIDNINYVTFYKIFLLLCQSASTQPVYCRWEFRYHLL